LKELQKRAIETVNSKYKPQLPNDDIMLASEAERLQILWHYVILFPFLILQNSTANFSQGEAYELWKGLLKESIMTEEEIAQIAWLNAELASVLKDEAHRQKYVAKLDALLRLFRPKFRQLELYNKPTDAQVESGW
jgi:DNA primase